MGERFKIKHKTDDENSFFGSKIQIFWGEISRADSLKWEF